jgi:hypothetical protein
VKLWTVCGVVTSRSTGRCGEHLRLSGIGANHHVHADARWARLSKRVIARHVGQYGYVCPGDGLDHPAHPSHDLTLDHVLALLDGGAPFDPANTRVLCRSRNSANGARLVNARRADRGYPHAGPALHKVRASQSRLAGHPRLGRVDRQGARDGPGGRSDMTKIETQRLVVRPFRLQGSGPPPTVHGKDG